MSNDDFATKREELKSLIDKSLSFIMLELSKEDTNWKTVLAEKEQIINNGLILMLYAETPTLPAITQWLQTCVSQYASMVVIDREKNDSKGEETK